MRYEKTDAAYLEHHGIIGQKWGVRRFQNKDGSLTEEGRDRYKVGEAREEERKQLADEEYKKLERSNQFVREIKKEQDRLAETYGLNKEDGEIDWVAANEFDKQEMDAAWKAHEKWGELHKLTKNEREKIKTQANERATKKLIKKYGDTVLSDIDYYNQENEKRSRRASAVLSGILAAVMGISIFALFRNQIREDAKWEKDRAKVMKKYK